MKTAVQVFFIVGSLAFLYWYMPLAMADDRVTVIEIVTIAINLACFIINAKNFAEDRVQPK